MKPTNEIARRYLFTASLMLAAAALVPACGDDDKPPGDEPDASAGGSGGSGTGGKGSGGIAGTGGKGSGGIVGSGGTTGTGGVIPAGGTPSTGGAGGATGGDKGDASVDGGADAGDDGGESDGGAPRLATVVLAGVTDYKSKTIISTIDLAQKKVVGESTFTDTDTIPVASEGRAFAVERTNGVVNVLTAAGAIGKSISLQEHEGGTTYLNPQTVLVIPGTAKAFVPLYSASSVAIVDLDKGTVTTRLDFSALRTAADHDGAADIGGAVFDAKRNRVYFVAQRVDIFSGTVATDYSPICTGDDSLLFALDATTNTVIDLNGSASGSALPLKLVGPTDVKLDTENDRLFLLSPGCDELGDGGKGFRTRHGIEAVDLSTLTTTVRYAETKNVYLANLLVLNPTSAIVESDDIENFYIATFYDYSFGATFGAARTGIPTNPVVVNSGALLGLAAGATVGDVMARSVVAYDVATKRVTSLTDFEWPKALGATVGLAVVK